ncbi:MAG: ABC transporter ATP-binding protein [Candidatus Eremiobacteraeota bacterium]|nr:ABC transporter ATP-binding protein [Candidatus Eremiobacteraeota bacterium]
MGALLSLEKVNKNYPDGFHAVKDVSFSVEQGETLCLLGTSGCGKTTLLKMINRLIEPTSGTICLKGRDTREWDVIALRRGIGYVIQSIGLFPHMTIRDNVALVPRLCGWDEKAIEQRTMHLMEMVHLEPENYMDRFPRELSGGQQQRVGVIRALAADPDMILMDEPFGALDPITRSKIQEEFMALKRSLGKTIIIVTHDLAEALRLGDRIALVHQGSIEQLGTPDELIRSPANDFVKSFFSSHHAQMVPSALSASDIALPGDWPPGPGLQIKGSASAMEAVAEYMENGGTPIGVIDEEGKPLGVIDGKALVRVFSSRFWEDLSRER